MSNGIYSPGVLLATRGWLKCGKMEPFVFISRVQSIIKMDRGDSIYDLDVCYICNENRFYCKSTCSLTCPSCGEQSIDNNKHALVPKPKPYSYKRDAHLVEHLKRVQGFGSQVLSEGVLNQVIEYAENHNLNKNELMLSDVRRILKALGLSKYYIQSMRIWSTLTQRDIPTISTEEENEFIRRFGMIQQVWPEISPKRNNMLSYSLILYNLCDLIGSTHLKPLFPLLKSRTKLSQQQAIWNEICKKLGWKYNVNDFLPF